MWLQLLLNLFSLQVQGEIISYLWYRPWYNSLEQCPHLITWRRTTILAFAMTQHWTPMCQEWSQSGLWNEINTHHIFLNFINYTKLINHLKMYNLLYLIIWLDQYCTAALFYSSTCSTRIGSLSCTLLSYSVSTNISRLIRSVLSRTLGCHNKAISGSWQANTAHCSGVPKTGPANANP